MNKFRRILPFGVLGVLLVLACSEVSTAVAPTPLTHNEPTSGTGELHNLALGKPVAVSSVLADFPAEMAVDGIYEGDNWWGSGADAPQWIKIDLLGTARIDRIELTVSQDPSGATVHRISGLGESGDWQQLHEFNQVTRDLDTLIYSPAEPLTGIHTLLIETRESPSWVAWREIVVLGTITEEIAAEGNASEVAVPSDLPAPNELSASILYYNGDVVTMNALREQAQALAVRGEKIIAVGSNEAVFAFASTETRFIDLKGHALLPGFVDPHTHLLNDATRLNLTLAEAQELALSNGITTLGNLYTTPEFLETLPAIDAVGDLRVRTSLYLVYDSNCGEILGPSYRDHPPTRVAGEMLRIGGVKMFADGGSCGIPAFSAESGLGEGDLWMTAEEMAAVIADAQSMGHQVAIHAIGDRAVDNALDAVEMALNGAPNTYRHRIDHNSVVRPDQIPRYSEIGIVPLIFGSYFVGDSCAPNETALAPEAVDWDWPYRELIDGNPGLHIAWHGDDPWVGPVSPLLELFSMTTYFEVGRDGVTICDTPDHLKDRTLTVDEALPMMTIEAAYALFREEEVGSLEPGKYADLIVLSQNPRIVDPLQIKEIEVWSTLVGGQTEFCAAGREAFCP